jgi:tetratricopeptide (TPR) repeat protein
MLPITIVAITRTGTIDLKSFSGLTNQFLIGSYKKSNYLEITGPAHKNLDNLVSMAKTEWVLYVKENEILLENTEDLQSLLMEDEIYGLQVLDDDVIIKEPRLWRKSRNLYFKNPVFEKLNTDQTKVINLFLYKNRSVDLTPELERWKSSHPLSIDVMYYSAFASLMKKDFLDFKRCINHYLFHNKKVDIPTVMSRYYLAMVEGLTKSNLDMAVKNIILCLSSNPLMAEFWCLLGDFSLQNQEYENAICHYENAILLGSRRRRLDDWPLQISKYQEYPTEMIEKCRKALENSTKYLSY